MLRAAHPLKSTTALSQNKSRSSCVGTCGGKAIQPRSHCNLGKLRIGDVKRKFRDRRKRRMNATGTGREAADICCFVGPGLRLQTPIRLWHSGGKCGTRMGLSLRKLTLAVALSLTVSSHRASMAAPTLTPPSTVVQEVRVLGSTNEAGDVKPRGLGIVNYLRSRGIPDEVAVMAVSALPIVELRGGIPLGHYLGVGALKTFLLAIVGNLAPLIPTMLLLRVGFVRSIASRFLERARKAADEVSNARSRVVALAMFVGVPLPGTGAWTGCLIAFILGMRMSLAMGALSIGVIIAGIIVSALCMLGWVGATMAGCLLIGAGGVSLRRMSGMTGAEDMNMQESDDAPIG